MPKILGETEQERISLLRDGATYLEQEDPQAYWADKPVWDLARVTARSQAENLRLFAELLERVGTLECVGALQAAKISDQQLRDLSAVCKTAARIVRNVKAGNGYDFRVTSIDFGELDFHLARLAHNWPNWQQY